MSDEKIIVNGHRPFTQADNPKPFTSEYQPKNKGRKPTMQIIKIMREIGRQTAPLSLRNDEKVKEFLEANNLKGTINDVLFAKLYGMALYKEDPRAFKLIFDLMQGKAGKTKNVININFISPGQEPDDTEELTSDQFMLIQGETTPTQ